MLSSNDHKDNLSLDPPCREKPPWGHSRANIIKWISWYWAYPLLSIGKKRELVVDDIDDIDERDTTQVLLIKFLQEWNIQLKENPNNPNLLLTIFKTIGFGHYSWILFILFFYYLSKLISVTCLQEILKYIEKPHSEKGVSFDQACGFAVGIFLCASWMAFAHHYSFHLATRVGVLIRQVLTAAILYKTFKIAPGGVPSSQVMNLMSTDAQRFQLFLKRITFPSVAAPFIFPALLFLCFRIGSFHPLWGLLLICIMLSFYL